MCGILCVLNAYRGGEHVLPRVLERVRRLRHRGPDWSGVHVHKNSVLAHERLAIVDVENGSQPLKNESGTVWLAVNGEIYNHRELRAEMPQAVFLTESDCEPILHMYEAEVARAAAATAATASAEQKFAASPQGLLDDPATFLNKLNGIFAFVLTDERTDRVIAARDHMGIIPLYMGRDADGALWFSSEMKALCDICVSFEDFLPGHYYDSREGKLIQWYKPRWHDESFLPQDKLDLTALREGLEAAVKRQLMTDVPYGVLLSGGLDSSVIAAVTARLCSKRIESDSTSPAWWPSLHSFSVGLKGSPDLKAARTVADYLHTIHHEMHFTIEEGLNAIHDVIYHLETYDVTTIRAATPMYLMSRKIKCLGVKMVLSGEGSDEMFGGYLYFHKCPNAAELQKECVRKLKGLYKFDCLRANKSTAAWGVEARVPFLDKLFLDWAMGHINPADKLCGAFADPKGRIEKWAVREAFKGYLPEEILWRQKEQFSDGVGYGWIDSLKSAAEKKVTDAELAAAVHRFPHNTPATKEAFYFRSVFETHFPQAPARLCVPGGPSIACSTAAALEWDASFRKFADCSGRSVAGVHEAAYDAQRREQAKGEALGDAAAASAASSSSSAASPPK